MSSQEGLNQTFHFTRCITPKRITSLRGHIRVIALGKHNHLLIIALLLKKWCSAGESLVAGNTLSDWTGPRCELQISRSRSEFVIARPPGSSGKTVVIVNAGISFVRNDCEGTDKRRNIKRKRGPLIKSYTIIPSFWRRLSTSKRCKLLFRHSYRKSFKARH